MSSVCLLFRIQTAQARPKTTRLTDGDSNALARIVQHPRTQDWNEVMRRMAYTATALAAKRTCEKHLHLAATTSYSYNITITRCRIG